MLTRTTSPERRTLPSSRCATPSFAPMLRLSSFESRNWNAEVRPITFSFGNCESAVIRSSDIPSEKYCSLGSPLSFASGSTAMEAAPGVRYPSPVSRSRAKYPRARTAVAASAPYTIPSRRRASPRGAGASVAIAPLAERTRSGAEEFSGKRSCLTRSTKPGEVAPADRRVHCSSRNRSGIRSSDRGVSSMTTGSRKA